MPGALLTIWFVRPWAMKPRAQYGHANGFALLLAGFQCVINDDHGGPGLGVTIDQAALKEFTRAELLLRADV